MSVVFRIALTPFLLPMSSQPSCLSLLTISQTSPSSSVSRSASPPSRPPSATSPRSTPRCSSAPRLPSCHGCSSESPWYRARRRGTWRRLESRARGPKIVLVPECSLTLAEHAKELMGCWRWRLGWNIPLSSPPPYPSQPDSQAQLSAPPHSQTPSR